MEDLSIDALLEFLYNRFAVTFLLCMFGSFTREVFLPVKKKKAQVINIKRIVTSTVFSTFLMCTLADYIELTFSAYAVVSIICGIWGLIIVQVAVNENFVTKFLLKMVDKIPSPVVKSAAESASEIICPCCEDKKDSEDSDKTESKENSENTKTEQKDE